MSTARERQNRLETLMRKDVMFLAPPPQRRRVGVSETATPPCSRTSQPYTAPTSPPTDVPRTTQSALQQPNASLTAANVDEQPQLANTVRTRHLIQSNFASPHACRHVPLTSAELSLSGNFLGNRDVRGWFVDSG